MSEAEKAVTPGEESDTKNGEADRSPEPGEANVNPEGKPESGSPRPWLRPLLAGIGLLLLAVGTGAGIGYLTGPDDPGPDLSREEAFIRAKESTRREIGQEMTRRGYRAGKRSGRSHGIIAGGMAAESAVMILVRQQEAAEAQSDAASAQSELAGMTSAPPALP